MSGFSSYTEHIVKRKNTVTNILIRLSFYTLCVILSLVLSFLFLAVDFLEPFRIFGVLFLFSFIPVIVFANKYFNVEYEYTICGGVFTVDKIYGKKSRKKIFDVEISDFEIVAPYNEKYESITRTPDIEKTYNTLSHPSHPEAYFAIFKNRQNKKTVFYFEAPEKIMNLIKLINRSSVRQ